MYFFIGARELSYSLCHDLLGLFLLVVLDVGFGKQEVDGASVFLSEG
jgi:hypothetical protein